MPTATVWKFTLTPGESEIEMPRLAKPLAVGVQGETPVAWFQVDRAGILLERLCIFGVSDLADVVRRGL